MHQSTLLRSALGLNALLSLATGGLLAVAPATVGGWLDVSIDGWLRLLGLALVGHGVALLVVARSANPSGVARLNVALIAPYPALMLILALTGLVEPASGKALVLLDGFLVGALALAQWAGVRRFDLAAASTTNPVSVAA